MKTDTNSAAGTRYLSVPSAIQKLGGISRATFWRLRQQPNFPRGYQVSPGRVVFSEQELEEYMANQIKE